MIDPHLAVILLKKAAGAILELVASYSIVQSLADGGHVLATRLFSKELVIVTFSLVVCIYAEGEVDSRRY